MLHSPTPELLGELHSGIPELGLELGLEAKENGSGAKLLTHGDDSDEEDEEEEEQAEEQDEQANWISDGFGEELDLEL